MRIAYVTPFYEPAVSDPIEAIERFPLIRELPREMRRRGHAVRVLSLGTRDASTTCDGVRYDWVRPHALLRAAARGLHRWKPRYGPAYYQPSPRLAWVLRRIRPDIVHIFGLTLDLHLALLAPVLAGRTRVFAHYHGGEPAGDRLRLALQRRALSGIEAALFTSPSQADPWIEAGLLRPSQVAQVLETSSPFSGISRDGARARTGMSGDPVYLSAGRLHPIKDPLTMLRGFAGIAARQPGARLYLYYRSGEMLAQMREYIATVPGLGERVEFRGQASASEMEAVYSSADFLLQSSIREWSGLAVLEAMSCGCIPIVSRIPSFTAMTADGRFGRHFSPGQPEELTAAALAVTDRGKLAGSVRRHFREELSFPAMARKLDGLYRAASRRA